MIGRLATYSSLLSLLSITACNQGVEKPKLTPSFTDLKMIQSTDRKSYLITGNLRLPPVEGYYNTLIDVTFSDGCRKDNTFLDSTTDAGTSRTIIYKMDTGKKIARARIHVDYSATASEDSSAVFVGDETIDPKIVVPTAPSLSCGLTATERRVAERKLAKTDPDAADADAISHMSRNEVIATGINSAGFLCARITDMYPDSAGQIIAHCVKYRSGRGRATYRIDANGGSVVEMD